MFGLEIIDTVITLGLKSMVPLLALWFAYKGALVIYTYVMTLFVEAKPNEWLVIMRNGKMVSAGIGAATMISPWDSVAIFPSRLVKVEFNTQQVTIEMQGVEVSTMLEWNIDRNGEGPMKAFKNLGSDLCSSNPRTANLMLGDMCSAILRARISNSTIDEIIKERKQLRDLILKETTEIVKGWGVFLETVEITDVRICSRTLFGHMQTKFRETQKQTAVLHKM